MDRQLSLSAAWVCLGRRQGSSRSTSIAWTPSGPRTDVESAAPQRDAWRAQPSLRHRLPVLLPVQLVRIDPAVVVGVVQAGQGRFIENDRGSWMQLQRG